jgi:hypothetical protein
MGFYNDVLEKCLQSHNVQTILNTLTHTPNVGEILKWAATFYTFVCRWQHNS